MQNLPLVESLNTMILLGSVERKELIKIIAKQISREKRLQIVAQWQKEVQDIRSMEGDEFTNRRVSGASDVTRLHDVVENVMLSTVGWQDDGLKNRRPSRIIDKVEIGDVTRSHEKEDDVMIFSAGKDENIHAAEVIHSETITTNSSGYTILENVKDSSKLLHKPNSTFLKTVSDIIRVHASLHQNSFSITYLFTDKHRNNRHVIERSETLGNITT